MLPEDNGSFVRLRLLNGGSMIASTKGIHHDVEKDEVFRLYDWAFYVHDQQSERHVLWDVGMSKNREAYIPSIQQFMDMMSCVGPGRSLVEQLLSMGARAEDVDTVFFSHAHFDHCRPIADEFPRAHVYFGPGTEQECKTKMEPHNTDPSISHKYDPRIFDPEVSKEQWSELEGPWVRFGAFDKAMDVFGNGSFWIIQAPGHMPGNLCAAARIEGGEWVLLGSDCAHSKALIDGTYDIAVTVLADGTKRCIHQDVPEAMKTIDKIREMEQSHGFHIALAHDATWMTAEKKDAALFSMLDEDFLRKIDTHIPNGKPF